jgi:hypothetical protein
METYKITPAVDAVREFLEIAGDFTNPLEIVREAVSNSIDARASEITIEFSAKKELGTYVVQALIEDNGQGMSAEELQAFFDLGNSPKRDNPALIGEKGHGTKVYFNCSSIRVETSKDGVSLSAEMQQPYASLHNGTLPEATVTRTDTPGPRLGTKILIKGVEHETLEFGHFFPEQSKPIQQLFDEHLVRAPDFFCKQILRSGNLPKNPFIHYDAVFYIEGNRVKQGYNRMLRRQGYAAPAGG